MDLNDARVLENETENSTRPLLQLSKLEAYHSHSEAHSHHFGSDAMRLSCCSEPSLERFPRD